MRTRAVVALVCCLLSYGTAQTFVFDAPPRSGSYLIEGAAGVAGLGLGAACGAAASVGVGYLAVALGRPTGWFGPAEMWYTAFAFTLSLPAWAGLGVSTAGEAMDTYGTRDGATTGAYGGALAGLGIGLLSYYASGKNNTATTAGMSIGALLIPAGAVVGYNLESSRGEQPIAAHRNSRVGTPTVALERFVRDARSSGFGVRIRVAELAF